MDIQGILNYNLIKLAHYSLTVYNLIFIIIAITVTYLIVLSLKKLINDLILKKRLEEGNAHSVFQIIKYFVWIISIVIILNSIGIQVSVLLASTAALLVGVGLGIQQLFNDIASGIVLLIERNLKVGDVIKTDSGIIGIVLEIGLRTSRVRTRDNFIIDMPNSKLVNNDLINWSQMDRKTRFHINVGIAYGSDVQFVKKLLLECANNNPLVSKKPPSFVRFNDFGDSSLGFQLYFWSKESFRAEHLKSDLRFSIYELLRKNNIQIPFPQRDVHIIK